MTSALDMSLDDIIKTNKKSSSSGNGAGDRRAGGRPSGAGGPARRSFKRSAKRAGPYSAGKAPDSAWQHDMYLDQRARNSAPASRASAIETGTKLYISNLDYGVSNDDIKELFSELGDLKRCSIHYDRSGRSKGTAEVVFSRRTDGLAAVKRFNNVQLDGKPMKIEIVGTNVPAPSSVRPDASGSYRNPNILSKSGPRRKAKGLPRRSGPGKRRGQGEGKGRNKPISAAELDADLENYHTEAMQTN
ncbi:THO complex subunit 4A-like [Typha latifolia]|uniref:THO complex subunit 4A-like n=1 Tax=Typha latifolia TaxID=4733 RepID=UPI003C2B3037